MFGYWRARILLTAYECGVFEALGNRSLDSGTVARKTRTDLRAAEIVLDALSSSGLVIKRGRLYSNSSLARQCLLRRSRTFVGPMLAHHLSLWQSWSGLTGVVREGKPLPKKPASTDNAKGFLEAMAASSIAKARVIAGAVRLAGKKRLLDIGGSHGLYSLEFCRRNPGMRADVFDFPEVARCGRKFLSRYAGSGRIRFTGGDYDSDPFPGKYDAALLGNIIHSEGTGKIKRLFRKLHSAMTDGGIVVMHDFFTDPGRTRPPFCAEFAVNMLINTASGRSYSAREVSSWLREAGFSSPRWRKPPALGDSSLLIADR